MYLVIRITPFQRCEVAHPYFPIYELSDAYHQRSDSKRRQLTEIRHIKDREDHDRSDKHKHGLQSRI